MTAGHWIGLFLALLFLARVGWAIADRIGEARERSRANDAVRRAMARRPGL